MKYKLICVRCGAAFDETPDNIGILRCKKCDHALQPVYEWPEDKTALVNVLREPAGNIWGYKSFYPVKDEKPVSIGEGNTPYISCEKTALSVGIKELYIKNEGVNPSGTYKDRGISVAVTKARALNTRGVILGSAGNAGASASAYAAKAGLSCYLFLPEGALLSRETMSRLYGAHVIRVRGTIDNAIRLSVAVQKEVGLINLSTARDFNPYCVEGYKSIGYELPAQSNFHLPDAIFVPVGGGSLLSKIWEGLCDAKKLGVVDKLPKMFGIQASGCAPLVKAFKNNVPPQRWPNKPDTIAFAIADEWPHDGEPALKAVRESGGALEEVNDEEIYNAQQWLCSQEAIFAEAAGVTPLAGLYKLRKQGLIKKEDSVALIISGTGLKDLANMVGGLKSVPVIDNNVKDAIEIVKQTMNT